MNLKFLIPVVLLSTGVGFNQTALAESYVNENSIVANASNSAKVNNIRRLLNESGVAQIIPDLLTNAIEKERASNPAIPGEYWDAVLEEIRPSDLVEAMVPIYDKYFDNAEIQQMVAFYSSPVAKKIISKYPQILSNTNGRTTLSAEDYKKYLTNEEMGFLRRFENSSVGSKMRRLSSQIQGEMYKAGNKVGLEAAQRAITKLRSRNSSAY